MAPTQDVSRTNGFIGHLGKRPTPLAAISLFAIALALYASTMAPGLTWDNEGGDGGDFLAAAHTWGIPHPTGYPTYIVLLRGFSELVWFGDEASNGNLFSAIAGAAAIPFFFLACRKLLLRLPVSETRGRTLPFVAAYVAALGLTTSNLHWSQSTITEVYALNALFVSLFLWLAIVARSRIESGQRALGLRTGLALLLGVAFGNHVTVAFIALPFGAWLYWPLVRRNAAAVAREWQPALALLAGLSVYIYAPIASAQDPALNWFFPDSFAGFRSMASASLYQPYVFGLSPDFFDDRLVATFRIWLTQFTAYGAILGLAGVLYTWGRLPAFFVASVASVVALVVYSIAYNTFDSFVFLVPVFIVFAIWIAAGLLNLAVSLVAYRERAGRGPVETYRRYIASVVIGAAVIGIPFWSLLFNFPGVDLSDDTQAADYVEAAFASAGANSIILTEGQQLGEDRDESIFPAFGLWYQSLVAEPEADVAVIAIFLLRFDWYWEHIQRQFPERIPADPGPGTRERIRAIVAHNIGSVPVFLTDDEGTFASQFELEEAAPIWHVTG